MTKRAKPSCKDCHGTGIAGKLISFDQKTYRGKISQDKSLRKIDLTCSCVMRATNEPVPWLQKHGKDLQPWLKEEENAGTTNPEIDNFTTTAHSPPGSNTQETS